MATRDPATGRPLPPDAIQRVLYIASLVHVYNIPPLTTTKGYTAATWTADPKRHIFSARLRILETATLNGAAETVKTDVLLEDPKDGALFAAAPYTDPSVVEQVLDSSRFFAVRVVGDGGRKAVLGIGFEQRPEAFDFGVTLQEVGKVLGFDAQKGSRMSGKGKVEESAKKTDYSLKEGETIHVTIGGKGRRLPREEKENSSIDEATTIPFLPPPPSADDVKAQQRLSKPPQPTNPLDSGFDDGDFGEFQ
jgi:hypothetical protein